MHVDMLQHDASHSYYPVCLQATGIPLSQQSTVAKLHCKLQVDGLKHEVTVDVDVVWI